MKQRGIKNGRPPSFAAALLPRAFAIVIGASTLIITLSMRSQFDFGDYLFLSSIIDSNSHHFCVPGNLSQSCVDYEASKMARAFPYRDRSTWCLQPDMLPVRKNVILRQGLILTKVPKAASSTSAGVALRITDRNQCHPAQWEHRLGSFYSGRIPDKSFLFTSIRAPDDRAISSIFYHKFSVTRQTKRTRPTNRNILRELQGSGRRSLLDHSGTLSPGQGGFTLQYTSLSFIPEYSAWDEDRPNAVKDPDQVLANVKHVLVDYDMLLVVDRMDESLVAMALLLDVDVGDVVVADSKITGETYRMWKNKPVDSSLCIPTVKSFKSNFVRTYLMSDQWRAANYGDYVLHAAANMSLDLTIDMIGRERFESTLAEYKQLKAMVDEQCADQIHLPCGPDGQLQLGKNGQSCYIKAKDFGCAHACVDSLFDKERPIIREFSYIQHTGDIRNVKASLYANMAEA